MASPWEPWPDKAPALCKSKIPFTGIPTGEHREVLWEGLCSDRALVFCLAPVPTAVPSLLYTYCIRVEGDTEGGAGCLAVPHPQPLSQRERGVVRELMTQQALERQLTPLPLGGGLGVRDERGNRRHPLTQRMHENYIKRDVYKSENPHLGISGLPTTCFLWEFHTLKDYRLAYAAW
jgi:hypothetical protein